MADYTAEQMREHLDTGKSRDLIITGMVMDNGMTLNAATHRYAELAKELGVKGGKASRREEALQSMGLDGTEGAALAQLITLTATDMEMAESTIRGYAKEAYEEADWIWPIAGRESDTILAWLVRNHDCNKEAFEAFMATAGKDGTRRSQSNINEYWKGMTLHRLIAAQLTTVAEDSE